MKAIDLYYQVKPIIPRSLQISIRRAIASQKRRLRQGSLAHRSGFGETAPGLERLARRQGFRPGPLPRCRQPEGLEAMPPTDGCRPAGWVSGRHSTSCPRIIRPHRVSSGPCLKPVSRVGVHGLKHDGKLFRRPSEFWAKVPRINRLPPEVGRGRASPRRPCCSKLNWIAELDIEYSCSTFDTDPFEPQSDGVGSIFPFLAATTPAPRTTSNCRTPCLRTTGCSSSSGRRTSGSGNRSSTGSLAKGGMVALNTHPDYMIFDREQRRTRRVSHRALCRVPRLHPDEIRGPVLACLAPGDGPFLEDDGGRPDISDAADRSKSRPLAARRSSTASQGAVHASREDLDRPRQHPSRPVLHPHHPRAGTARPRSGPDRPGRLPGLRSRREEGAELPEDRAPLRQEPGS